MQKSGVKFGTSGARGLVSAMSDFVCYSYTRAFIEYLQGLGDLNITQKEIAVAGDLRPSTERIMIAVMAAIADCGCQPINAGFIPTPALAYFGLVHGWPSIMVTGSHIPADRNGIKFYKKAGEILKNDEAKIRQVQFEIDDRIFDEKGNFIKPRSLPARIEKQAEEDYLKRYTDFFPNDCLKSLRIGLYEHSAVGRDILHRLLIELGAKVETLGRAKEFTAVDNEALEPKVIAQVSAWSSGSKFDALVSTDGDSDRPIIWDENGNWIENDLADILCASYLGAQTICTTLSCNTALEKSGWFKNIIRTKIGSPYVIEAMIESQAKGLGNIIGYENNGGLLLQSAFDLNGKVLAPLPTRDAFLVLLSVLSLARRESRKISELFQGLPQSFVVSGHIVNFDKEKADQIIQTLNTKEQINMVFEHISGPLQSINDLDGLRLIFENGEVIHLRPSGNAPEMRIYSEAETKERAAEINKRAISIIINSTF